MFRVVGHLDGRQAEATWTDGAWDGDPALVASIAAMVATGAPVQIAGLVYDRASNAPVLVALATVRGALDADPPPTVTGDTGEPDPVPDGATP